MRDLRRSGATLVGASLLSALAISSAVSVAQGTGARGKGHASFEQANFKPVKDAGQPEGTPNSWVEVAVQNELKVISKDGQAPLRFRQRKVDAKGDTTRDVIESKDGNVARLVERNGQPLTAAEDAAERDRLTSDIASPDEFMRHRKRDEEMRDEVVQLVGMMPQAMIYSYAPGQPQTNGEEGLEVVLDFHPDPAFRPPTMYAEMLTGLEGRVWIDARSKCIVRIEAHVLRPVNFGFGVLAKIFPGGTVELEQTHTAADRWVYSHVDEHLTARVLLVKTVPQNSAMTSWDFRPMPSLLSYQDAIRVLLATPIPLR
jgi:hypothetical protein